jgi:hypothetical protein
VKPVQQTKRGGLNVPLEERGDCLNAAIASVLEVPIERVVIPWSEDEHWWDSTQRACETLGFRMVVADVQIWPDTYWLAGVPSLNLFHDDGRPVSHMIVMQGGQVAHDPCLGRRYEVGASIEEIDVTDAYVLVPLDLPRAVAA